MRTTLFGLFAASTALAAPAMAQDVNPAFTGPRVGVVAGWDSIRAGTDDRTTPNVQDETVNGLLYGVDAGYDIAIGGLVAGAEVELTGSTGKVDTRRVDPNTFGFGRVSTGRDIYVGGRLGGLVTPATLLYGKVGYTNARLDVLAGDGTSTLRENYTLDGFRLGAGVEQAIGFNSYAKVEYRYSNYNRANFEFASGGTSGRFDVDTDRHQIVAGFGLRF